MVDPSIENDVTKKRLSIFQMKINLNLLMKLFSYSYVPMDPAEIAKYGFTQTLINMLFRKVEIFRQVIATFQDLSA